jgi:hypothetical protein
MSAAQRSTAPRTQRLAIMSVPPASCHVPGHNPMHAQASCSHLPYAACPLLLAFHPCAHAHPLNLFPPPTLRSSCSPSLP